MLLFNCLLICYSKRDSLEDILYKTGVLTQRMKEHQLTIMANQRKAQTSHPPPASQNPRPIHQEQPNAGQRHEQLPREHLV